MVYYLIDEEFFYRIKKIFEELNSSKEIDYSLNETYRPLILGSANWRKYYPSELSSPYSWNIVVKRRALGSQPYSLHLYTSCVNSSLEEFLDAKRVPSAVKQKLLFNLNLFDDPYFY